MQNKIKMARKKTLRGIFFSRLINQDIDKQALWIKYACTVLIIIFIILVTSFALLPIDITIPATVASLQLVSQDLIVNAVIDQASAASVTIGQNVIAKCDSKKSVRRVYGKIVNFNQNLNQSPVAIFPNINQACTLSSLQPEIKNLRIILSHKKLLELLFASEEKK